MRRDGLDTEVAATKALTIVVVEEDHDRAIAIVDALKDASECEVFVIGNTSGLARKIAAHAPDIVLIDIDNPTRDALEELTLGSRPLERPVAMFVSGAAEGLAQAAIEAGVSAYVVDGLSPRRIKPVLDTAIARFALVRQMRSELAETRRALEERKVIDGAKGVWVTWPQAVTQDCRDAEACFASANSEQGIGGVSASFWVTN